MTGMYPKEIILLAARECAAKQKNFDSVMKLLESWKDRGFTDEQQILEHIGAFHEKEEFLKALRRKWAGKDADIGRKTMEMLEKWENSMGFSREMISLAADAAFEAKRPLTYMDKLLTNWSGQGIRTPAAVQEERKKYEERMLKETGNPRGKTVTAQQYSQRDYEGEQEAAMRRMLSDITEGGDGHA